MQNSFLVDTERDNDMVRAWWLGFLVGVAWAQPVFVDSHYTADIIHSGNGVTVLRFDPAGRLFAGEKQGRVLVFQPDGSGGYLSATVFADLTTAVDHDGESGLLGMAIDPAFLSTRYLYLFYTTFSDQRVVRLTANASFDAMEPGSETVILSGFPRSAIFHKAGGIAIDPNNPAALWVSLGDDGFDGVWPLFDGLPRVQHPDYWHGKILRISRDNGLGISTNPFWDGDPSSIRSRVWAVGFRNPFRFTSFPGSPGPNVMYVSENGDATDRISWVQMGSNGAWNVDGDAGGFLNPPDPNHRVMATQSPSVIGVAIADEGPFAPGGPTIYWANWLSGIRRFHLSGTDLDTMTPIPTDGGAPFTTDIVGTDMVFGPDGNLYTCHSGGDDSVASWYTIFRIRFEGVDPPIAAFTTTPAPPQGSAPLMVDFTDSSVAPGSAIASWTWEFGDGSSSHVQNPSHTYSEPGYYEATLTVSNTEGLLDTESLTVKATRTVSVSLTGTIFDGRTLPGAAMVGSTELRFYQITGQPIALPGGLGPDGNGMLIKNGTIAINPDLDLTADGFLVSAGEPVADGFESAMKGLNVPATDGPLPLVTDFYLSDTIVRGRVHELSGPPASVDLGIAFTTPENPIAVAGGRDFSLSSGIPMTGLNHRRDSDELGYFHFAVPSSTGPGLFFVDAVADTGSTTYAAQTVTDSANPVWDIDLQLARFGGGSACDDLSAIPTTMNVDYDTMIQPIWDVNCTSCHNATAVNSGGLDLLPGVSETELLSEPSGFAPGLMRVEAGSLDRSFLFEKINCEQPQVGTRMRPTNAMALVDQALIRDWIMQLDESCMNQLMLLYPTWPNQNILTMVNMACP